MQQPKFTTDTAFAPASRVWTYVANRPLTAKEQTAATAALTDFTANWTAHDSALRAKAEIFADRVLFLVVDETHAGASGCSIDKSVHFLENLGEKMNIDWFDRMIFGWVDDSGQYQFAPRAEFTRLVNTEQIRPETLVVNTLVDSKQAVSEKWLVPFGGSWQKRFL